MLDDDAGGLLKCLDAFPRRIGIANVVIGQLLALQLSVIGNAARLRIQVTVKGCILMWIFAVAHVLHFGEVEVDLCWVLATCTVGVNCS